MFFLASFQKPSSRIGNVQDSLLQKIVAGQKLEVVWKSTKDNVLVCRDCEYRYVCFDCRPMSEGVNQEEENIFPRLIRGVLIIPILGMGQGGVEGG